MTFTKPLVLFLLSVFILGFSCGCATLPDVAEKIDAAPTAREPRQIVSAKGLLSPKQSKAIMDRLQRSVRSANLDYWRSLVEEEVSAVVLSREYAAEMEKSFATDLVKSDEKNWEEWKERPVFSKLREWFAHLFVYWL